MEVAIPVNPTDHFQFNSSAYTNAPSTPRLMGENNIYYSAPNSPARISESYTNFDHEHDEQLLMLSHRDNSHATVPFAWEERPGVPKAVSNVFDADFAFDVSGELQRDSSVTAEDLFHDGVIKNYAVMEEKNMERERGRERENSGLSTSRTRSRRTRSLPPPFRGSEQPISANTTQNTTQNTCTTLSASGSGKGSKKWSFMDLFLFRSASDGRAMDRDPLKKYSSIFRKHDEDFRNSIRDGSGSGSGSKRRGRVSAHELHYTVNRAVSNDMKKKTFLPYKQGILGRLAFNPSVHALSNGFGYSHNN